MAENKNVRPPMGGRRGGRVVEKPKDLVSVGDKILVKALGYDNRGRLNLSRKQALPKPDKKDEKKKDK